MALNFLNDGYFAGKVGIGTESPNYKLAVYGSTSGSEIVASFGNGNAFNEYTAIGLSGFIASNGATKAGIALKRTGTYGTGELHFLNNNTIDNSDITLSDSKMTILGNGNVGIGTDDPDEKLEIAGSLLLANNSDIKFNNSAGNKISTIRYNSSNQLIIANGNSPNGDIHFQSDVTSGLMMILDGATDYVGIGNNTSPKSMLDVQGGIKMADDTDTASADKVGTMRYRTGTEYVEVTGTELVTNGDFTTDTSWTKGVGWSISGGKASSDGSQTGNSFMYQTGGLSPSYPKWYKVVFTISNYSSGDVGPNIGGYQNSLTSGNGEKTIYLNVTNVNSNTLLYMQASATFVGSIDNLSIMEVTEENASYADMCMQTGASTYEWVNIVRNTY